MNDLPFMCSFCFSGDPQWVSVRDRPIIRKIFTILSLKVFLETHSPTPQSFRILLNFLTPEINSDIFFLPIHPSESFRWKDCNPFVERIVKTVQTFGRSLTTLQYFFRILRLLRPAHHVNKAYQPPPVQCCFIVICFCIKPSQTTLQVELLSHLRIKGEKKVGEIPGGPRPRVRKKYKGS